jgi:uncharacterized membrane protein
MGRTSEWRLFPTQEGQQYPDAEYSNYRNGDSEEHNKKSFRSFGHGVSYLERPSKSAGYQAMYKVWVTHISSVLLGAIMCFAGCAHLASPGPFDSIVPSAIPFKLQIVVVSGIFEILGGIGLVVPFTRHAASIGLILLFIAVFPANVNMAMNNIPINGHHFSPLILWLRLPLQAILIAWAFLCGDFRPVRHQLAAG